MNQEKKFQQDKIVKTQAERTINDAKILQEGAEYVNEEQGLRLEITGQQYDKIHQEMERILAERLLTDENIQRGVVEMKVEKIPENKAKIGQIGYEFEIEKEARYKVAPLTIEGFEWVTHVIDTYDKSGRARIRIKDGKPRLSLKVPLFTQDTEISKTCLRLEFKPRDGKQETDLLLIKELILKEAGAQTSEKWGTRLSMKNGISAWLNRDSQDNWWIEIDQGIEFQPPEGIRIIGVEKSAIAAP